MAEEKERKIPVFTVTKNGAILKNIFVIKETPEIGKESNNGEESEETLIVGRHPDCNIVLTHPSISRFHLQIHCTPSSHKLSILDLSSVHGTWVSGERIPPGVMVEVKEEETIKIGGSTRLYKLQWIPISCAYDMENPFKSAVEESKMVPHQGESILLTDNGCPKGNVSLLVEEKELEQLVGFVQDQSPVSAEEGGLQSMDWILEGIVSLFSDDENSEVLLKKEIPSAPPMPQNLTSLLCEEEDEITSMNHLEECKLLDLQSESPSKVLVGELSLAAEGAISESLNQQSGEDNENIQLETVEEYISDGENQLNYDYSENIDPSFLQLKIYAATEIVEPVQVTAQKNDVSRVTTEPLLGESFNPTLQEKDVLLNSESQQEVDTENLNKEDAGNDNLPREDYSENTIFYSASPPSESVNSSLPTGGVLSEPTDDKRNSTPQSLFAPAMLNSDISSQLDKWSNMDTIWSRRGKIASVLQIQTGRSTEKIVEATKNSENEPILKSHFGSSDEEEEIFTPDKENFTPNSLLRKALKAKGKLGETKHSSKATFSPNLQPEDDMIGFDKENQKPTYVKEIISARKSSRNRPKLHQERNVVKGKAERVPFQSIMVDSACKNLSEGSVTENIVQSSNSFTINSSMNKSTGEGRRIWTMVADTTSLMDKESRKSLQLLQGLKGTRLFIPRTVIRELDCLKQRGSLFRRKTEASSILEWIEECMVTTKWWIHVQSTMEEEALTAPTPPATPLSQLSEGNMGNPFGTMTAPFSSWRSLKEITSPTAEDHILDCVLLYRRMKSDEQLVLLSNDITLKIKAMAEGLICETVQEFRQSLVNPFSERFMWALSSARGQTWSALDDVVLREKYNRYPRKKPLKGDVKGLKLILLHNSHYGQINSVR